jgi:predicted butyrate kinase (DUF1464 family)
LASISTGISSEPQSKTGSVGGASSASKLVQPSGQKKSKRNHHKEAWQESLAKAQLAMVEQTRKQNELLSSQSASMKSIAKDLQTMAEDNLMSKDLSLMSAAAERFYEFKQEELLKKYNLN